MPTFLRVAATALAVLLFAAPVRAEFDADQKEEIGQIIRDYLLANPEILEEAFGVLEKRKAEAEMASQASAIEKGGDLIFDSKNQMVLGNPEGAITLVEFFDYNCGYCKRAVPDMMALLSANPDLRIVIKEFPILSEGSIEAARVSVAVKDVAPDKYLDFHQELFSRPGQATATKALEVAGDLGIDAAKLKSAADAAETTTNIQEVHQLASLLGISGTPSYVIGTEVIPGAMGYELLQAKVAAIRECGKTMC